MADHSGDRAVKRQRLDATLSGQGNAKIRPPASRIFAPYRTVGLISPTSVPFTSVPLGKTTFQLTTSTGRALQTFDLRRGLQLVFASRPQTPGAITATYAWKEVVLAAWHLGQPVDSSRVDSGVWIFKRGQKVGELPLPQRTAGSESSDPLTRLQVLGSWLVGASRSRLEVWKRSNDSSASGETRAGKEWEHYTTIKTATQGNIFTDAICSVPTLLNKILVGISDGSVEIWNVRTGRLVYRISPPTLDSGPVTALEPSTALGVVAIARADKSIALHDAIRDRTLLKLRSEDRVTTISFRTDGMGAGEDGQDDGVMASASSESGDVILWDLNGGGRIQGILRGAHNPPSSVAGGAVGGVSGMEFLTGQAILVTTGLDNALKTWIFDQSPFNPVPRVLHSRSGHAAPVTRLQFLPTETEGADSIGKWLLSAGRDRSLWGWSLRRDGQSTEISQGNIQKKAKKLGFDGKRLEMDTSSTSLEDLKAPEIISIACNLNRDGGMGASTGGGAVWANVSKPAKDPHAPVTGWESMVTGHRGDKYARTWFWGRKKAGRWAFETGDKTEVASVAMSPCGTFALVGSAGGSIDMFNLQSGRHRQKFPRRLTAAEQSAIKMKQRAKADGLVEDDDEEDPLRSVGRGKHKSDVTGLIVDSMNRTVVSSSLDGTVKFWDFATGNLRHEIDKSLSGGFTACRYHRGSDLLALACNDMSIQVVDIETRKTVRELWGCVGQIKDLAFSNDGRWLVASSMDSVVRVWDLPTAHLIDAFRLDSVCTSLAFSPTGEFLATAHAESIGISVWSNRSLFRRVPTRHIAEDEDIARATLPTATGEGAQDLLAAAFEEDEPEVEDDGEGYVAAGAVEQLNEAMTTLSLVPRSRWQTLLHLDLIAQRNKPIEPPKAPEKAPFFLPSLGDDGKPKAGPTNGVEATLMAATTGTATDDLAVTEAERARLSALQRNSRFAASSTFSSLLHAFSSDHDDSNSADVHEAAIAHLKSLPPAAADIEIRSLRLGTESGLSGDQPDDGELSDIEGNEMATFVRLLTARLRQRRDYEIVQAWMAVFLKIHGEAVTEEGRASEQLRVELHNWREVAAGERSRLGGLVGYCGGVVQFLRSAR